MAFRGFLARLSILLGVVVGWLLAAALGDLDGKAVDALREAAWVGLPDFHAPQFSLRAVVLVSR